VAALKLLERAASHGAERLQCSPAELLLLTQGRVFANQSVVFPIEALAVRALAGLFGHRAPLLNQISS
jgi:hypothetical protein